MEDYLKEILEGVRSIRGSIGWLEPIKVISFFAGFLIVAGFFSGVLSSSDKVTDYSRSCNQENTSVQDCTSWNFDTTTYILNESAEEVMWYDGRGDAVRTNCQIGDTDNWYCDAYAGTALEGNGQNIIGFAGGNSIENTPAYPSSTTQHFGFWTYWWYKISNWL